MTSCIEPFAGDPISFPSNCLRAESMSFLLYKEENSFRPIKTVPSTCPPPIHFRGKPNVYDNFCFEQKDSHKVERELYSILKPFGYVETASETEHKTACAFNKRNAFVVTPSLDVYKCEDLAVVKEHSVGKITPDGKLVINKSVL